MNIIAYYKGYHVDVDSTADLDSLEQAQGQVNVLIGLGFKSSWNPETAKQALAPETPAAASHTVSDFPPSTVPTTNASTAFANSLEDVAPKCGIHGTPMVKRTGTYKADVMAKDGKSVWKKAGEAYEFWACPTKNADGSYCSFKPKA